MNDEQLTEFIESLSDFLVPLRLGEPLDEDAYEKTRDLMAELKSQLAGEPYISKELALNLIDFYPFMLGSAAGRSVQAEAEKIEEWAEDILDLIREAL